MNRKIDESLLSQLVDGELTSDRQNELLSEILDDTESRERLKEHLRLRSLTGDWRRQEPTGVVTVHVPSSVHPETSWARRLAALAAAAVIGGVLVAGGFLLAHHGGQPTGTDDWSPVARRSGDGALVTKEERERVAQVFRFHESVAGPLTWYAADDGKVLLGSAAPAEAAGKPVAVLLRLASAAGDTGPADTYVIVCRDGRSANIELPESAGVGSPVRLYLAPAARDGTIEMQYALTQSGVESDREGSAAIAGRRQVGLKRTRLGQLALGERLINVDAAAWVISEETRP